ncbi:MAG TPA: class I SAM-dependent methyltransferase [Candidatus Binatia bacterium]|nr:class I SAM-dependent methyltransferase [Candidatus Binatia bacterium]
MMKIFSPLLFGLTLFSITLAQAQERFSFFQASTVESVTRMLKFAGLRDDDVLVDLGSGNGLIPITAAQMNPKLRAWGVDVDEKLIRESNQAAKAQGVGNRVRFFHRNAFDTDLREATVVTMWLFPELMRLLRPTILKTARPGTRILTSTWDLGSWAYDEVDSGNPTIYKWIVPASVEGYWSWKLPIAGHQITYSAVKEQRFQAVEGVVRAGKYRELLQDIKLRGEDISFALAMTLDGLGHTRHEFKGKVRGDQIEGRATVTLENHQKLELPWHAERTTTSLYFAPTGTEVKTD